ncbi:MAG: hypothetical protein Q9159_005823 [Coniocarpon cinnabarinum]
MQSSSYTRKKEEEEAKRAKDRAEREAVLEEFTKYFDEEEEQDGEYAPQAGGKRHRALGSMPSSGPGTLDNEVGFRPLPKKARIDEAFTRNNGKDRERRPGKLLLDDDEEEQDTGGANATRSAKQAAAKPTLQLQNLPLSVSEGKVGGMLPSSLEVVNVRIVPPPKGPSETGDRKSVTAVVTLHAETAGRDIDEAIRALDNNYVGYGHYLKASRGLSSTAMESRLANPASLHSSLVSQPFGARNIPKDPQLNTLSRAPPPSEFGNQVPPPASYAPGHRDYRSQGAQESKSQVNVVPPSSLNELKAIHRTIEGLLSMGPRFEALLMSRPEVQNEEKWAWIWNARSRGGVYYRWRLWSIVTGAESDGKQRPLSEPVFQNGAEWANAGKDLPFEFLNEVGEIRLDSDYDTDAEEESDDEGFIRNKQFDQGAMDANKPGAEDEANLGNYLDPMQKAKFLHLLTRLPTTIAKLTRGDVARVMAFAIGHANVGVAEVVDLLVINVLRPFSLKVKNTSDQDSINEPEDEEKPPVGLGAPPPFTSQANRDKQNEQAKTDDSGARLVSLYLISDIMSASMSCNVRSAWRYRSLFEAALQRHNVFGKLGRLDRDLQLGRITAEKFKRSVHTLLAMWQEWSAFSAQAHQEFVHTFDNPPLTEEEQQIEARRLDEKKAADKARTTSGGSAGGVFKKLSRLGNKQSMAEDAMDLDVKRRPSRDANTTEEQEQNTAKNSHRASRKAPAKEQKPSERQESKPVDKIPADRAEPASQKRAERSAAQPARKGRARAEDMFADSD